MQEKVEEIVDMVRQLNETLKDSRIDELCKRLDALATALDALANRKHHWFDMYFTASAEMFNVKLHVKGEYIGSLSVEKSITAEQLFERIFGSQELRDDVIKRIHETLTELAREVAEKSNLVERLKEIEKRLREEDP